jgi:hypothetical protein
MQSGFNPQNIVDVTDDQRLEDTHGNVCRAEEMLIYPDRIEYYYPECGVRRIVRIKPHILPKPSATPSPYLHD